ncbi:MAG: DUF4087 domain-containing protein [Acidobacteria bacterium]|nr:MAG: DUF4087 domain-containing protein [Acidobacteriota bacterium]
MRTILFIGLVTCAFVVAASLSSEITIVEAQTKAVLRCGWFSNPTPANAWLVDRDGEWTIGIQGGYQAEGDWPDITDSQWVKTNNHYGYGCACIKATVDRKSGRVIKIVSSYGKPLTACRKDPSLKRQEPK